MNGAWTDVQNWLDLLDHVWIGLVLIAVAAVPSWFAARNHDGIKQIKDQVVNGHKDPMRSDLDKVITTIADLDNKVDSIAHSITSIREELVVEETRRRTGISDLRDDIDRRLDELRRKFRG